MKKYTHPLTQNVKIILTNGSTFSQKWNSSKKILKIDFDYFKNSLWIVKKNIN
jgi:hypothetical protein